MAGKGLNRPAFSAPLYAAVRQGGKEFAQGLKAFPDSIHPVEEPGTLGNPTPQMVTEQSGTMGGNDRELDRIDSRRYDRGDRDSGPELGE